MEQNKYLMITSDDYGYSDTRDDGILECFKSGAITGAAAIVNGVSIESGSLLSMLYEHTVHYEHTIDRFTQLTNYKPPKVDGHQHAHVASRVVISNLRTLVAFSRSPNFAGLDTMGNNMTLPRLQQSVLKAFQRSSPTQEVSIAVSHRPASFREPPADQFCELMVHPGYKTGESGGCGDGPDDFSRSGDREHEMRILMMNTLAATKNAPPTGGHAFQATGTIFELVQNIIGTNLLTKFHDDRTINMASRVLTRKNATPPWRPYIIGTNHLTKFHDDRTINVASRVLTRKNAQPPYIIRTNLLTKFHEDRKINAASRVLTRKNAPPPGSHTKFHEHQTINVASRVFTRQNVDDGRCTTDKKRSQKLTMSTLCSGELKNVFHLITSIDLRLRSITYRIQQYNNCSRLS
ncbi:hypothetical protein DPMN_015378 [Dreissena polymorpha]|uniref:Carbohydrate deacetylase n=1 Tax=Dreissena polymorpha TaxID=45954 RepID=A0A9D4S5F0_DREPO|nr:hypothetical protein DPMN_015378 [Dreissena polymorpha]